MTYVAGMVFGMMIGVVAGVTVCVCVYLFMTVKVWALEADTQVADAEHDYDREFGSSPGT